MKEYMLYGHGGSYNHGAEASVKCNIELLRKNSPGCKIILSTHFPEWDKRFNISADEMIGRNVNGNCPEEMYAETIKRITSETVCLSVGGDNYCYPNWERYAAIHKAALSKGAKSILWSCSLEASMIDNKMLEVLKTHHLITAREGHTYKELCKHGLKNVIRVSDIAFLLEPEKVEVPQGRYVVMNLSPLVMRKNPKILVAFQNLLDEIIKRTNLNVVLLPHVEVAVDNDIDALNQLIGDETRIVRVPTGMSAAQYKYIISKSEACVAARTHATIAAWSSFIPTLAISYSMKARGIAEDLEQSENVVNVYTINEWNLCDAYFRLWEKREIVRKVLGKTVPPCMERALPHEVLSEL